MMETKVSAKFHFWLFWRANADTCVQYFEALYIIPTSGR